MRCARLLLITTLFPACGNGGYPAEAQAFFNEGCELTSPTCRCVWETIEAEVPYDDWEAFYLDQPTEEVHGPRPHRDMEATAGWERLNGLFSDISNACQEKS